MKLMIYVKISGKIIICKILDHQKKKLKKNSKNKNLKKN